MSHVTDIILSTMIEDGSNYPLIMSLNPHVDLLSKYLNDEHAQGSLVKVDERAESKKAMQCGLFIAAINGLDIQNFLKVFYKIKWECPECVQLMLKDEHDDIFSIYTQKEVKPNKRI